MSGKDMEDRSCWGKRKLIAYGWRKGASCHGRVTGDRVFVLAFSRSTTGLNSIRVSQLNLTFTWLSSLQYFSFSRSPAHGEDPVLIPNFEGAVVDSILNPLKQGVVRDGFGFDAAHF